MKRPVVAVEIDELPTPLFVASVTQLPESFVRIYQSIKLPSGSDISAESVGEKPIPVAPLPGLGLLIDGAVFSPR